jgi:RNA polymerase sigma factor (TIGR02999 family)
LTRSEDPAVDISATDEITELLLRDGDAGREVLDRLVFLVYEELRRIAHNRLRAEPAGHTLDTSGLVHEAYLKLVDQTRATWRNRSHFLSVASTAMRRILVDHARMHHAAKRGGRRVKIPLDHARLAVEDRAELLVELDEALDRLDGVDERLRKVVECRFFGGMTEEETAEALGVTSRTVRSDWATAKGLLLLELSR